jgi:hypothetical protein
MDTTPGWQRSATLPDFDERINEKPAQERASAWCQDSGSFRFVDVFLSALLGAEMDRPKFEHAPIVPPIVKSQLPTKASRGLDFEIRPEYPLFGIGNHIC